MDSRHMVVEVLPQSGGNSLMALLIICCCGWQIYRTVLTWYRLRHVPTPSFLAGWSYLWLARSTYSGKQYWRYRELHRKLGPVVRIGPNDVVTDDPEIIRKISSPHSGYARSSWYIAGRFNPNHDNLLTILDPKAHKVAKSKSAAAYSGRETTGLESAVDVQVKVLLNVLRTRFATTEGPGKEKHLVDLGKVSSYFTMDVISRLAFGQDFGYLTEMVDHYDFFAVLRDLWPRMSTCADIPWIRDILFSPLFLRLKGPRPTDKTGFGALMGVAERFVKGRFSSGKAQTNDMLDSFIKRGFSPEECQAEGLFLLLSGTESTACAIRSTVVHLATSPVAYNTLKAEIRSAVRNGTCSNPISFVQAGQLPYLQAVVYEGIRMRPPLLGLWPKVVPAGGDTFHGKYLPAGTSVGVNHSALLRSTCLFGDDADVYNPDRFMRLEPCRRREMERNVELAFGYGQWMCAGKSIALMELNKVVFEVFRAFDVQLISPFNPCEAQSYGVFVDSSLFCKISEDEQSVMQ